ncbi:cGMP-specific 3',5'-cyclic phosphodiesterase-like isoform X2 [Ischnura elegans]|uniref:cGMP-specific 3',5'-cyclic phosphodiesterase-like isoform X2 n=1 Tax=Ischnura elegans TaxID=197161 RepID=UPI001ED87CA0|nr:cGMP-specific 3',5'-cyclic phosphodiesterase-like isoform X2 [Ischnura elegans]
MDEKGSAEVEGEGEPEEEGLKGLRNIGKMVDGEVNNMADGDAAMMADGEASKMAGGGHSDKQCNNANELVDGVEDGELPFGCRKGSGTSPIEGAEIGGTAENGCIVLTRPESKGCLRLDKSDGTSPSGRLHKSSSPSGGTNEEEEEERGGGIREVPAAIPRGKRDSVTSELFHMWLSSPSGGVVADGGGGASRASGGDAGALAPGGECSGASQPNTPPTPRKRRHLDHLDEGELFMELVRDVATELDLDVLCYKILVNVGLLTSADRGSLFLARGPRGARSLAAKLFDVSVDTPLDDALRRARQHCPYRIPFGVGIAGIVAQTKQGVNINNAYEDSRFNPEMDERTGYMTKLILCMPICNREDEVIGVAQIINKTDGSDEFTPKDEELFRRYLTFCGIGIQNAQLFEMSVLEYRRNQILLHLARSIFEEQNNLECLVTKIMREARDLLRCERCAVFLLDLECCESSHLEKILERPGNAVLERKPLCRREGVHFQTVFELRAQDQDGLLHRPSAEDIRKSSLAQIAEYVAATGQILNIGDVTTWMGQELREVSEEEGDTGFVARSLLCMPISSGQHDLIGVAQLINKASGHPFSDSDVSIFEAFAIFCGLGIHNTQMYENACKLMAKQKVALECLSYHATASLEDTDKLNQDLIPTAAKYNLYSFMFSDFELSDDDTCRATIRMFMDCSLISQFHIPYQVLCRWVLSVRKNYRPVKYHNWRHALNVAQTMFAMLKTGKMERFMNDLDILGLLVACLCHDLDHRGTNNAFQTKTESPLAILYTTSTMEHHHFDQCVMILNSEGNNIFQALSPKDYRRVMKIVEMAILSTDLAMYFKKKDAFRELVDNGEFDWQSEEKKELLCGMMMTGCDVSAIAKPWEVQHKVAKLVADEFFDQGDLEKLQLNQQPVAMMDRERKDELPQMQVGFIDVICLPLYRVLSETFPWIEPLLKGCQDNRQHWQDLAEKVEMGLTWIDHDTIDKPVEEFLANSEVKDIEFTVTTLNCAHTEKKTTDAISRLHRGSKRSNGSGPIHPSTAISTLSRLGSLRARSFGKAVRIATGSGLQTATAVAHPSATLTTSLEGDGGATTQGTKSGEVVATVQGDVGQSAKGEKGDATTAFPLVTPTAQQQPTSMRRWLPPTKPGQAKQKGHKTRSKLCSLF